MDRATNLQLILTETSVNRTPNTELSPHIRSVIIGMHIAGQNASQIARILKLPGATIRDQIRLFPQRHANQSLPRSGHPRVYTDRDERRILRIIRKEPKIRWRCLKLTTGLDISLWTFKRLLKRHGIRKWLSKKRPELTEEQAAARLAWAQARRYWTAYQWRRILWSDECSVERGTGVLREWVFRRRHDYPYFPGLVQTYPKGKQPSVMIWAGFSGLMGRSALVPMINDPDAPHGGYSARSYIVTLEQGLLPIYDYRLTFMQDNAPIHTANAVRLWLEENEIELMDWPVNSPDLNPIEHLWFFLKNKLHELYPESDDWDLSKQEVKDKMAQVLPECWEAIDQRVFDRLAATMSKRIKAVIKARGWYTKY
jgi:Transposase/DDE superfamily endonuclease